MPHSSKKQERFSLKKLFSSAELVLVKKDLNAIWSRKGVRALLMAMPLLLVVVLPIVYFAAIGLLPDKAVTEEPKILLDLLSIRQGALPYRPFWTTVFTTLLCPVLYLCVPIVCSVAAASCTFFGEKENSTIETLFLSSMSAKSVFHAKITVCTLISVIISWISFVVFGITVSIADLLLGAPYFFNLEWLVMALLLTPALSLFSVVFVSAVLSRVYNMTESIQTMGYLLLPFIVLYLIQFVGVFRVTMPVIALIAAVLGVLAIILFNLSSRKFQAELLFGRSSEE